MSKSRKKVRDNTKAIEHDDNLGVLSRFFGCAGPNTGLQRVSPSSGLVKKMAGDQVTGQESGFDLAKALQTLESRKK